MDDGDGGKQAATKILQTSFIAVAFSACQYYKNETALTFSPFKISFIDDAGKKVEKTLPVKKKSKTIYLTFDDGPNKGTAKVMHIVEEEQIPVTFFIVGEHVYGSNEQKQVFDSLLQSRYIQIANHSYSHAFHNKFEKFYTLPDSAVKDFLRCADSLHLTANIVRTPGRNIWRTSTITSTDIKKSVAAADTIYKKGFTQVGWDLEWRFTDSLTLKSTGDEMLAQIDSFFTHNKTKTPNHLVLLAHDQVYADARDSLALKDFITKLKAKDEYNFEPVSKYPGLKN
jgi:peptidoglycan/xylan/chitin deacetylase (PgdA/CDA1 family)